MFRVMNAKTAESLEIHRVRLRPELTAEQAKTIFALGEQAVVFALLAQAKILQSWYEEIGEEIILSGVLYADETGWRINGPLGWLRCFTTPSATLFAIERSRASPVVLKFITEPCAGVLVSDFWAAYSILVCVKQRCLVHLLRDLERVEQHRDTSGDWARFAKKLRRLIQDAIRLRKRWDEIAPATY